jgi:hypothetical protein
VRAKGGSDDAADVFSGLQQAAVMDWGEKNDTARIIIHIADRPCHGLKYSRGCGYDSFPNGKAQWVFSGCQNHEIGRPFLFKGLRIGASFYVGTDSANKNSGKASFTKAGGKAFGTSFYFSGCSNKEVGLPFLFKVLIIGIFPYFNANRPFHRLKYSRVCGYDSYLNDRAQWLFKWLPKSRNRTTILIQKTYNRSIFLCWCEY